MHCALYVSVAGTYGAALRRTQSPGRDTSKVSGLILNPVATDKRGEGALPHGFTLLKKEVPVTFTLNP